MGDSGALAKPIYSVFFSSDKKAAVAGAVTYGDFDSENCDEQLTYVGLTRGLFETDGISIGSAYNSGTTSAWSDFADDYVSVPESEIDAIAKVFGATLDTTSDQYQVACDATLPSITIALSSLKLEIPGRSLVVPVVGGSANLCELRIVGDEDRWIFGSALAEHYCQVFDISGERLGFSKPK